MLQCFLVPVDICRAARHRWVICAPVHDCIPNTGHAVHFFTLTKSRAPIETRGSLHNIVRPMTSTFARIRKFGLNLISAGDLPHLLYANHDWVSVCHEAEK